MTILILGGADDEHALHVLQHLRDRGHDAELLDSRDFPTRLAVSYDPSRRAGALDARRPAAGPRGRVLGVLAQLRRRRRGPELPHPDQRNWPRTTPAACSSRS